MLAIPFDWCCRCITSNFRFFFQDWYCELPKHVNIKYERHLSIRTLITTDLEKLSHNWGNSHCIDSAWRQQHTNPILWILSTHNLKWFFFKRPYYPTIMMSEVLLHHTFFLITIISSELWQIKMGSTFFKLWFLSQIWDFSNAPILFTYLLILQYCL